MKNNNSQENMHICRGFTQQAKEAGFTLVEMLVSIGLFAVVVTMSVSTLLVLIDANGRAQNTQLVVNNLSFALDSMTREIRTGSFWNCHNRTEIDSNNVPEGDAAGDCASPQNALKIVEVDDSITGGVSENDRRITYWFKSNLDGRGAIMRRIDENPSVPLTGPEIDITAMSFSVIGTQAGDSDQPTATIYIKGRAGLDDVQAKEFELQTTITQRELNL